MRKVIGIGETVYDIVFRNGQPEVAVPGGSTFNSMVSVGRCGIPAVFLSEVGKDKVGDIILDFMAANGVDSGYVSRLSAKTPVSLAFLNENNDASYTFYRDPAVDRTDFSYPPINKDDVVLFGSFYALNPACRDIVRGFLRYAKDCGAILYYDVNFRPSHIKDLGDIGDALWENFSLADVVRGSHEDFLTLFGIDDAGQVFRDRLSARCGNFICTFGPSPLKVMDIHGLEHALHQGKLSFASPERMMRCLGLKPGSVSPFGLIEDIDLSAAGDVAHAVLEEEATVGARLGEVFWGGEGAEDALCRSEALAVIHRAAVLPEFQQAAGDDRPRRGVPVVRL